MGSHVWVGGLGLGTERSQYGEVQCIMCNGHMRPAPDKAENITFL